MNLLLHILKTDARHCAALIATWASLTILAMVLDAYIPRAEADTRVSGLLVFVSPMLWLARVLTALVLIVTVVQAHTLVGTTAFWLTRPVPRRTLLAAKLVLIALAVVVVPALCDVVLMTWHRVPAADIAAVVLEWVLIRAILASVVMVVAAFTRSLSQFALAMAIGNATLAIMVLGGLAAARARTSPVAVVAYISSDRALEIESHLGDQTGAVVAWLLTATAASVALWVMYRARRRGLAVAVAIAGVVVAAITGLLWPWPLLHATPSAPSWADSQGLRLEAPSQQVWFLGPHLTPRTETEWQTAVAQVFVRGLAPGWFASARLLSGDLRYEGQTLRSGPSPGSWSLPSAPDLPTSHRAAVQHALGLELPREPWQRLASTVPILFFRTAEAPLMRTRGNYNGAFAVSLYRVDAAAVFSLADITRGAVFEDEAYRFMIRRIESRERGPMVTGIVANALSVFHRDPRPQYSFYLRNGRTGEVVEGRVSRRDSRLVLPGVYIFGQYGLTGGHTGFFVEATDIRFTTPDRSRSSTFDPGTDFHGTAADWLASSELVILRTTLGGRVRRNVSIPSVAINGGVDVTKAP